MHKIEIFGFYLVLAMIALFFIVGLSMVAYEEATKEPRQETITEDTIEFNSGVVLPFLSIQRYIEVKDGDQLIVSTYNNYYKIYHPVAIEEFKRKYKKWRSR